MSSRHSRSIPLVVITLGCGLLIALLHHLDLFDRAEWISYDHRMTIHRQEAPLHPDIAVVLIDEASLQALDPLVGRWPWPRSLYGDLIEFFAMGGARAAAFDILFTERQGGGGTLSSDDERFASATRDAGNIYHAMQVLREELDEAHSQFLNQPLPDDFIRRFSLGDASGIADIGNNSYLLPFAELRGGAAGVGIVEVEPDSDSVYRRARLVSRYQSETFAGLGLTMLLNGETIAQRDNQLQIGNQTIPLTASGHYLVNMVGGIEPWSIGGILASIQHLYRGEVERMIVTPDEFAGKYVFIGASAIGLQDIKTTPLSAKTPGVFIHAAIASNILNGQHLKPLPPLATYLLIGLFSLLTALAILWQSRLVSQVAIPLLLLAIYSAFVYWQFGEWQVWPLIPIYAASMTAWLSGFAYLAFTEGKDKRKVRGMLSQYVSPAVLETVMDNYGDHISAEIGKRENLSILFSDIRGFTTLSEELRAEQVVDLLNNYFDVMTEIIFRHEGTLDKFIGDAIMAFWGAPIRVSDHADRAVVTAIEMIRALDGVNQRLREKGYPAIAIGVGIGSGEVILGNIGSSRKLDYTVIGDNVNLSSRLEGLTKPYHSTIIISEATHQALSLNIPCAPVDLVRVKGKHLPIQILTPLALPSDPAAEFAEAERIATTASAAFAAYLARDWDRAIALYRQCPADGFAAIFLERCDTYRHNPPPENWDGVYTLTSK
jgi:adenylate cyclase